MASLGATSLQELIAEKKRAHARGGAKGGKSRPAAVGRQAGGGARAPLRQRGRETAMPYAQPVIERQVVYEKRVENRVSVSGLPYDWEEHEIRRVLATAGEIESLQLGWDNAGRSTGTAQVTYRSRRGADQAINELNGAILDRQAITVSEVREEQKVATKGGRGAAPGRSKGSKGAKGSGASKGGKGRTFSKKGSRPPPARGNNPKIERKALSRDELDAQLDTFLA